MADTQDTPSPSDKPHPLDDLIASIRAAVAPDASGEIRAIGAAACRSILTALETQAGQPRAVTPATPASVSQSSIIAPDGDAPPTEVASSTPGQQRSDPGEGLADDVSAGALLREVAHIEDTALPARYLVQPGDVLGPYRIVKKLGRGANGVVYEAEDRYLLRVVALKVLALSRVTGDERHRRFLREARAASAVMHPNVAAVYAVGHDSGLEYLAMEYVAGTTLRELMQRRGDPFEIADAMQIGIAIASGVGSAHELGIVHRDLKPENVMIADTGTVKVLDFGLAKLFIPPTSARDELLVSSHSSTVDGRVLGTPAYMSPEQSKGHPVDARSDVFALGVVLYELLTGSRPFRGETAVELFIAIDRDEPLPPSSVNPQVPPSLEAIVLRCLCKSPGERFASCREVADTLCRVSSGEHPALTAVTSGTEPDA
jgi:eukaryotic-like serine/threonine-protein kinase